MADSNASREAWSARYERLRAGWLVQELSWGQALLIRQGMAAWMKAWPAAEPSESAMSTDSVSVKSVSSQPVALAGELHRQLARELTNLILHRRQEATA